MYNHSPKDDAHKQSNSKEKWITDLKVVVDLTNKVKPETITLIIDCIKTGKVFVLHNNKDEMFYYNPMNSWGQWKNTRGLKNDFKFRDRLALLNSVKLQLLEFHHVLIPDVKKLRQESKLIKL